MENKHSDFIRGKSFDTMSTASLYALLEEEMDADPINVARMDAILAVLSERTPSEPVDVDAAWNTFTQEYYTGQPLYDTPEEAPAPSADAAAPKETVKHPKKRSHPIRVLLIVAAILVALGAITVSAANRWQAILSWTGETFGLTFGRRSNEKFVQNPELAELAGALAEHGADQKLLPNYLPEGYTQAELLADGTLFSGVYENGDQAIVIQIREIHSDTGFQYEQDRVTPDAYTVHGVTHYISANYGTYTAAWVSGDYECTIQHAPSREELLLMIDSIYSEE